MGMEEKEEEEREGKKKSTSFILSLVHRSFLHPSFDCLYW